MISDQEFIDWEMRQDKKDVYLVDLTGFDKNDNPYTFRAASRRYLNADYIYYQRLQNFEATFRLESGVSGISEVDIADLSFINVDAHIEDLADARLLTATVKYGDQSWDLADFRTVYQGKPRISSINSDSITFKVDSLQSNADIIVHPSDFTLATSAARAGTAAARFLVESGQYSLSDLDIASFNDIDNAYPFDVQVTVDADGQNLLDLVDACFAGISCDLTMRSDGKLFVPQLKKPSNSTTFRPFKSLSEPTVEIIPPLGKLSASSPNHADVEQSNSSVKSDWPHDYREESFQLSTVSTGAGDTLLISRLNIFDVPFYRVRFETSRPLSGINVGDEIKFLYNRYGFDQGRYGIISLLTKRMNNINVVEVWIEK